MIRAAAALSALLATFSAPLSAQVAADPAVPDWRRGGVCYEIFVRSFYDSDDDGIGDLPGLIEKLDYVNDGDPGTQRDLGASCVWLMPVAQSPSYHGYDVSNYYRVNSDYGTNEDFERLVAEAHKRGIAVLVDLVPNHVSSAHPYFKSALLYRDSPFRDWFLWSPTVRPSEGWQAPVWHHAGTRDEYYYGLFWGGMPDLNLGNPAVTAELKNVARFWLEEMGVDGFRIDAVSHLFEGHDGEWRHAAATHPWLRDYSAYIRRIAPHAFTVGEVTDSTRPLLAYYPDQLDAYFSFEVSDALIHAVRSGSGHRLLSSVQRAERDIPPGRWSPFLRNHDQTRTLTELGGDLARAKLAATLLLTVPGLPFVYYGEEIGMTGDKPDPRLRTPMHWSREPAAGFTRGVPWEPLQPDSFAANVEAQEDDSNSLLNRYRRLIHLRAANTALGSGDFVPLNATTDRAVAYLRRTADQTALVVANLGSEPLAGVSLTSSEAVLPPGSYVATALFGGPRGPATLRVASDGRIRDWIPLPVLEPFDSRIIQLTRSD